MSLLPLASLRVFTGLGIGAGWMTAGRTVLVLAAKISDTDKAGAASPPNKDCFWRSAIVFSIRTK